MLYAPTEDRDYDFVTAVVNGHIQIFTPVQIKELVPSHTGPSASVDRLLAELAKYVDSGDLVVAIHVNREMRLAFQNIPAPEAKVAEVWLFGSVTRDQSHWFLYGDLKGERAYFEFPYPI